MVFIAIFSIFRNTDSRLLKMLDFPRIQYFVVSAFLLILLLFAAKIKRWYDIAAVVALLLTMSINGTYLINYTFLVAKTLPDAGEPRDSDATLSIFLINVKMENRQTAPLLDLIRRIYPTVVLAMETDKFWERNLASISGHYPYIYKEINDHRMG